MTSRVRSVIDGLILSTAIVVVGTVGYAAFFYFTHWFATEVLGLVTMDEYGIWMTKMFILTIVFFLTYGKYVEIKASSRSQETKVKA